jgi:glycosyltransferase involved in cell wall biosynthesis
MRYFILDASSPLGGIRTHSNLLLQTLLQFGREARVIYLENHAFDLTGIDFKENDKFIFQDLKSWNRCKTLGNEAINCSTYKILWVHTLDLYRKFGSVGSKDLFNADAQRLAILKDAWVVTVSSLIFNFFLTFAEADNYKERLYLINNSILPRRLVGFDRKRSKRRNQGARILLYLGRLDGDKNINFLKTVLNMLFNDSSVKNLNLRIIIVGDGESKCNLTKYMGKAAFKDFVTFLGYQDESQIFALLCEAEAILMPSLFESDSFAVIEAAALGCPIILQPSAKTWQDRLESLSVILPEDSTPEAWVSCIRSLFAQEQNDSGQFCYLKDYEMFKSKLAHLIDKLESKPGS